MAVRLKFANDLNIFGSSRGAGGFLSTPVLIGGGYPAYGTVLSTGYGVDYEIGATVYSSILAVSVFTYTCDVDTKADGVGGSFIDWANAVNTYPKNNGTLIATSSDDIDGNPQQVPSSSGNYYNSGSYSDRNEVHNGTGGIDTVGVGTFTYFTDGTYITGNGSDPNNTQVPATYYSSYYFNGTGTNHNWVWNGTGGYRNEDSNYGSYYSNGTEVDVGLRYTTSNAQTEVPMGSGAYYDNGKVNQDTYYWDGSGGFYGSTVGGNPQGSFFPFTQFITNDNCPSIGDFNQSVAYYWDGNNGWYINTWP